VARYSILFVGQSNHVFVTLEGKHYDSLGLPLNSCLDVRSLCDVPKQKVE
jgi:hypothetical protein